MKKLAIIFFSALLVGCSSGTSNLSIKMDSSPVKPGIEVFKTTSTPAPTVLVLHGCGGVDTHHFDWARQLQQWGFNAVIVDSFKPRFVSTVCDDANRVAPIQRAIDAHSVAKWASEQGWSTKKIGVIGYSHGGWTVLRASTKEDAERDFGKTYISSAVAFYPYCGFLYQYFTPAIPLQIHIGLNDDWTPANYCKQLARDWKIGNQYFEYENSHHGFDRQGTSIVVQGRGVDGKMGQRTLQSNSETNKTARARVKEFFDSTLK